MTRAQRYGHIAKQALQLAKKWAHDDAIYQHWMDVATRWALRI